MAKLPTSTEKVSRVVLVHKVTEVLDSRTTSPADDLRATGAALIEIADAIDGTSPNEAIAILQAAFRLYGFQ